MCPEEWNHASAGGLREGKMKKREEKRRNGGRERERREKEKREERNGQNRAEAGSRGCLRETSQEEDLTKSECQYEEEHERNETTGMKTNEEEQ